MLDELEVVLIDKNTRANRTFRIEATPVERTMADAEGNQIVVGSEYAIRIFENGRVANAGNMKRFRNSEDGIQWGFELTKEWVKK